MDFGVIDLGAYQSNAPPDNYPPPVLSIADAYPNVVISFTTSPTITNTLHLQASGNLKVWTDLATYEALSSPSNISHTISQQGVPWHYFRLLW